MFKDSSLSLPLKAEEGVHVYVYVITSFQMLRTANYMYMYLSQVMEISWFNCLENQCLGKKINHMHSK